METNRGLGQGNLSRKADVFASELFLLNY